MTVQGREAWEIAFDEWCPLEITDPAKAPKSVHVKGCWQTGFQAGYDAGRSAMREEAEKAVEQEFAKTRAIGRRQRIKRDTFDLSRSSWFHLGHDRRIHIVNQQHGKPSAGQVTLTPAEFRQFCRFYERAQQLRKR